MFYINSAHIVASINVYTMCVCEYFGAFKRKEVKNQNKPLLGN